MLDDEQYEARDMVVRLPRSDGRPVPTTGIVPKFSRTPGAALAGGPRLGEHTEAVLRDAGVSEAELAELTTLAIIASPAPVPAGQDG